MEAVAPCRHKVLGDILMNYQEFLTKVIDEGVVAAKGDYTSLRQQPHLHGSVAGFEVCRGKQPAELSTLLKEAETSTNESRRNQEDADTYWFKRCYELEIGWVCNVVSALLMNEGLPTIVPVSARGMFKAAGIVGVEGEQI
jgi:hypothetical protein